MPRLLVSTATYNEVENIEPLVQEILLYVPEAEVLVIDDASPDGTGRKIKELQQKWPQLKLIERPGKLGLGTAHKRIIGYALEHNFDVLVTMDADFSHNPRYIPELVERLSEYDFVIGSRYAEGAVCRYTLSRILISRIANILVRVLLGVRLRETTTSFRAYQKTLLQSLDMNSVKSEGYSFFVEAINLVHKTGAKMAEYPIDFEDRRHGVSKISKKEIIKGVLTLFRLGARRFFSSFLKVKGKEDYGRQSSSNV